jgi:hypothetical protein
MAGAGPADAQGLGFVDRTERHAAIVRATEAAPRNRSMWHGRWCRHLARGRLHLTVEFLRGVGSGKKDIRRVGIETGAGTAGPIAPGWIPYGDEFDVSWQR